MSATRLPTMLTRALRSTLSAATYSSSRLPARTTHPSRTLSTSLRLHNASDTAKVSSAMRRFWKSVSLHSEAEHFEVKLDNRSLRTPDGTLLKVPKENRLLATLIVHEWNEQSKVIKSHALPMVSAAMGEMEFEERETDLV